MKMIKLFSVFLITVSISMFAPTGVAASKADKQKQAQQKKDAKKADKKRLNENKKNYKKVEKPKLKERKAKNKKDQKQAKNNRKQAIKNLDKSYQEAIKFSKAKNGAKAALLKQHKQMQAAIKNYEENPSPKSLKARDGLVASYANSYKNYMEGPKQRWLNKVAGFNNAVDKFDNSDRRYKKILEDGAAITRDKVKAKAAIKNTKPVQSGIYGFIPTINSSAKAQQIGKQLFVSTGSIKDQIYGRGPPSLAIYDIVPSGAMRDYGRASDALFF